MANVKKIIFDSKVLKNGKSPLAVRLIKDRKIKYFFIGHSIHKDDWDEESQSVKNTVKNHKRMNFLLKKQEALAEEQLMNMEGYHQEFTIEQVTKKIKRNNKAVSFTEFATEYLDGVLKEGRINVARSDKSRLKNITAYNKERPLYFHEVNVAFLNNFITYLRSKNSKEPVNGNKKKKKISEKTVNNHLLMVRTIFNRAIREQLVSRDIYPFGDKDKIQVKQVETHKVGLDQEELNALQDVVLEEGSELWHARNAFLLSFNFAGVRISDLLQLTWAEIQGGRLLYQMGKTDASVSIPIPAKAKEILAYYKPDNHAPERYVLPYLQEANKEDPVDLERKINSAVSKINKKLKKVAKEAGIDKNILL